MITGENIRTLGIVGTGAIGVSWAALGLSRGLDIVAWDPADGAGERLRAQVTTLLDGEAPAAERIRFAGGPGEVAAAADLVLESGPERLEIKRELFAALDDAAAPGVLLASSSSGLMPSTFQDACARHPERMLVAHPFNPPHLVPLVEVVGGRRTSEEAIEAAMTALRHLGKKPIRIRQEVPGHVANRLQAALWREAYSLVDRGIASVADIDTAIADGPGLRWSLLGPFATQHVSGGPGGLRHALEHLGPPMVEWWETLGQPEWTPELIDRLVTGMTEALAGTDTADLVTRRDQALRQLMRLKTDHDLG